MNGHRIEIRLDARSTVPDDFPSFFESIADALYDDESVSNQDVSGDAVDGSLTFRMTVESTDAAEAILQALNVVRSALHAAGVGTAGWERHIQLALNAVGQGADTGELLSA